ncbi:tetratricopeptide repeat-containing protein [Mycena metata]|uniref:Tetratricopeptide repeat-containing protein n=1 Tax=Mycena metata TaxID=1033252 RepID=A0AAD7HYI9_9AGAR|nr:tetratricopeptide repeat-containing protein [Mycena metata]
MDSDELDVAIELNSAAQVLQTRFEQQGNTKDIEDAIVLFREAVALSTQSHPNRDSFLHNLGTAVKSRFERRGDRKDMDEAIELLNQALVFRASPHPDRDKSLDTLALVVSERFKQHRDLKDIDQAVELFEELLTVYAPPHPDHARILINLASSSQLRFQQQGDPKDINRAVELYREALPLHPSPHRYHGVLLNHLANALKTRFEQQSDSKDLDEAIQFYRESLAVHTPPHHYHVLSLDHLARALLARFEHQGNSKDVDEAIKLHRQALTHHALPHSKQGLSMNNLARALQSRFKQIGNLDDIDEAIELHREALLIPSMPSENRGTSLYNLANALRTKFELQGNPKDIDEAIKLHGEALVLHALPHPHHGSSLNTLGRDFFERSKQTGDATDLDEAIELYRAALIHDTPAHPNRAHCLNNLGAAVRIRFERQGDAKDIDEAIELHREALVLHKPPHPQRGTALVNLAIALRTNFRWKGDSKCITEAIELHRQALVLHATPHPDRSMSLNSLANALIHRFQQWRDFTDINEAIELLRQALALRASTHPARAGCLNNLALAVKMRFAQQRDPKDIDEAIELQREAVLLHEQLHANRGTYVNNLALAVTTRFEERGDSKDVDEAIALLRETLEFQPPHHPNRDICLNNLADVLYQRSLKQGALQDLDEAIELNEEAVNLRKPPHPDRGRSLSILGLCLALWCFKAPRLKYIKPPNFFFFSRGGDPPPPPIYGNFLSWEPLGLVHKYQKTCHSEDLNQACSLLQEATAYSASPPIQRFNAAHSWAWAAGTFHHSSVLAAYRTAIQVLPQLAALHLDLGSRQQIMSTTQLHTLASDAANCAMESGEYNTAVEYLEASRSIFWSQALQVRTPLDTLANVRPDLSVKLTDIARQLEQASFRDATRNVLADSQEKIISIESEDHRCRLLNEQWDEAIKSVQLLPGFENFMKPKGVNALKQAAVSGPIIILTTVASACFALIITLSSDVQCLRLPQVDLPRVQYLADLSRALSTRASDFEAFDIFREFLADLWKNIVKPVFNALSFQASTKSKSADPPRLWWCPTGNLSFLPFHAAGIYGPDVTDCASDYVVSSYTPTVTALLDPPVETASKFQMTASYTATGTKLDELKKIVQRVPKPWLTTLGDTTPATIEPALTHLRESAIVHFACHGTQDLEHPLDSGLILTDGRLKVSEIMRRPDGGNALDIQKYLSLAFLSACETAKGDKTVPDEAMHLAATLLFAGFRSVVATMWTMNDLDGPKVADIFYKHLFKNCDPNSNPPVLPNLTLVAKALHVAVAELRKEPNIPFRRWVPFVHYGL